MDFIELVKRRYSVRSYKPDPVENEKLRYILECALLAPTAANRQAIKVILLPTEGHQERLKSIYNSSWFCSAPYLLCVCSIPGKCWTRSEDGKNYSDVDAAIVMDHIVLAATELELGTCWVAAFDVEATRAILKLEDAWEPIAFTPLGYSDQPVPNKKRKPLEEVVIHSGPKLGQYDASISKKAALTRQQFRSSLGRIGLVRKLHRLLSGS